MQAYDLFEVNHREQALYCKLDFYLVVWHILVFVLIVQINYFWQLYRLESNGDNPELNETIVDTCGKCC